jgi:hypothetical protein
MRRAIGVVTAASFLFIAAGGICKADDDIAEKFARTRIETFLAQKDRLLVKEVYTLGKITGLYSSSGVISAIITYEPDGKENRLKGLLFEVNEGQNEEKSQLTFLDMEEIEGLSSAIAAMGQLTQKGGKEENSYTEIIFTTRDELIFGIYLSEAEKEGFITTGGAEKLTIFMEPEKMNDVKKIVDYGYTLLKMK